MVFPTAIWINCVSRMICIAAVGTGQQHSEWAWSSHGISLEHKDTDPSDPTWIQGLKQKKTILVHSRGISPVKKPQC